MTTTPSLPQAARDIRREIINCIASFGGGHVGGCLSLAELLAVLYFDEESGMRRLDPANPQNADRDRLVMSKGHAGPALYSALALRGFITVESLRTLNQSGGMRPGHCDMKRVPGVDMSTGSLGQGLSVAVGMALAADMDGTDVIVHAVIGDGESQEGQIWEAALFAANRGLGNLIAFTDYNKVQLDGWVADINDIAPLSDKWRAFGWHTQEIDGHCTAAISQAIAEARRVTDRPSMIILDTVKGKGAVDYEGKDTSHHGTVSEEQRVAMIEHVMKTFEAEVR